MLGARNAWRKRIIEVTMAGDGALPPAKKFKAKHDLPELADYRKPAPDSFWDVFPCNRTAVGKSMISGRKLEGMARAAGCWTPADRIIIEDLEKGADIGCKGEFRNASFSKNAESAFKFPAEITDAVAAWITKGLRKGHSTNRNRGPK